MSGPRVAVVGAGGFIGSRLVEQCHLRQWADVVPIVRTANRAATARRFNLECRIADVLHPRSLEAALDGCEVVVHAAAGDRQLVTRSVITIYHAAVASGVRHLVYLSSMAVHGWRPTSAVDENSPLNTRHSIAYNNWKVLAERTLVQLNRRGRLQLTILRPGIVYGPRSQWMSTFAEALANRSAAVVAGGSGICNAVYVDNLNQAIKLAWESSGSNNETFLINDQETITWRQLYEPICLALGYRWAEVCDVPMPEQSMGWRSRYEAARDAALTQRLLRWLPVRLRYAISQAADAWIDNPLADGNRRDSNRLSPPPLTWEQVELQSCNHRFPTAKAEQRLGYTAEVSFPEAIRRTAEWLRAAGFGRNCPRELEPRAE